MKNILIFLSIIILVGCGSSKKITETNQYVELHDSSRIVTSQDLNTHIISRSEDVSIMDKQIDKVITSYITQEKFNSDGNLSERTTTVYKEDLKHNQVHKDSTFLNTIVESTSRSEIDITDTTTMNGESEYIKITEAKESTYPKQIAWVVFACAILIGIILIAIKKIRG